MNKILLLALLALTSRLAAAPAPDFNVIDSDGNDHKLYADYLSQGKLIVIEVFFVNCPPCATHAPYLQTLYQAKKSQHPGKLEFLLLTNKSNDHNAQVAQYKISKGLTMPAVSADGGSLQAIMPYENGMFGDFLGTPTFIVIAPGSGEVFFDVRGNNPQATMGLLGQLIDQLLVPAPPSDICPSQTPTGAPVDSVRYTVDAANWDTTFWSGNYTLANFPALNNPLVPYTVSAFRNDHHGAGVSTFDLVLMSKHILGIDPFTEDWKKTAADVNGSGTVTTFDIVETRKLILGIYDTFPSSKSWRFLPASSTQLNGYCFTFQCIKTGDVNGSFAGFGQPDAGERDGSPALIRATDRPLTAGQVYQLDLRADADATWLGLQMSLGFDPATVEVLGLESAALPGLDAHAYNLARQPEGFVPISWVGGASPATLRAGEIWLTIRFRALQSLRLSEVFQLTPAPLRAEAYAENGDKQALELLWGPPAFVANGALIAPNPAIGGAFALTVEAAAPGEQLAQLFDNYGRLVFTQTFLMQKGENRLEFRLPNTAPGLYCLMLDGMAVGKVLLP